MRVETAIFLIVVLAAAAPAHHAAKPAAAPQAMQPANWFSLEGASLDAPLGGGKLALNVPKHRDTANDITVYDKRRADRLQEFQMGDGAYNPMNSDAAQSLLPGPQWHSGSEQDTMTAIHKMLGIGMGQF
jgi:hypothetical protein